MDLLLMVRALQYVPTYEEFGGGSARNFLIIPNDLSPGLRIPLDKYMHLIQFIHVDVIKV